MTPANEILRDASYKFNEYVKNAQRYGTKKQPFNEAAHAAQVAKNFSEEYIEMQAEVKYSQNYWFEFADVLFCAYTADKIGIQTMQDAHIDRLYFTIQSDITNKGKTCALPYPYAIAVALSNLSKFFTADENKISAALHFIDTKRPDLELWQTKEADGTPLYFFSKGGKVQKVTSASGYVSKNYIADAIWGNFSIFYEDLKDEKNTHIWYEDFTQCTDEVEMAQTICQNFFPKLMERI